MEELAWESLYLASVCKFVGELYIQNIVIQPTWKEGEMESFVLISRTKSTRVLSTSSKFGDEGIANMQ